MRVRLRPPGRERLEDTGLFLVNILRRLPLSRLLLLCAAVTAFGASLAAIALAVSAGPIPPPKPLAQAIHDALAAPAVDGVEARIKLTNHLLEGAELAGGGEASQLSESPLISGASGRLWIAKDGRARLELQAERGDTQVLYDGKTVELYDAVSGTLYTYTPPAHEESARSGEDEPPTVAKIEEAISHAEEHANLSGATPTDVAGQAAYTLRVSPKESGSLIGAAELSWDAVHGAPLRAAIYSSKNPSAVIELAASEISYGPVDPSVFQFTPPPGTKVQQIGGSGTQAARASTATRERSFRDARARRARSASVHRRKVTTHGHGITSIAVIESPAKAGNGASSSPLPSSLPRVKIGATSATELATALGTILTFERGGVRYVLVGALPPAPLETLARGL